MRLFVALPRPERTSKYVGSRSGMYFSCVLGRLWYGALFSAFLIYWDVLEDLPVLYYSTVVLGYWTSCRQSSYIWWCKEKSSGLLFVVDETIPVRDESSRIGLGLLATLWWLGEGCEPAALLYVYAASRSLLGRASSSNSSQSPSKPSEKGIVSERREWI
jgi:hypothetical protein